MRSWACATSRRALISLPQPVPRTTSSSGPTGSCARSWVLLLDACRKALETQQPGLTVDLLHQAWRDIKRAKVVNFLDHLRAQEGVGHA